MLHENWGCVMRTLLVITLISSSLLVQCYTQYQYTPADYEFDSTDVLVRLEFDKHVHNFSNSDTSNFTIKNDSLIVKYELNTLDSITTHMDTLSMMRIKNLTVLNNSHSATAAVMIGITLLLVSFGIGMSNFMK